DQVKHCGFTGPVRANNDVSLMLTNFKIQATDDFRTPKVLLYTFKLQCVTGCHALPPSELALIWRFNSGLAWNSISPKPMRVIANETSQGMKCVALVLIPIKLKGALGSQLRK